MLYVRTVGTQRDTTPPLQPQQQEGGQQPANQVEGGRQGEREGRGEGERTGGNREAIGEGRRGEKRKRGERSGEAGVAAAGVAASSAEEDWQAGLDEAELDREIAGTQAGARQQEQGQAKGTRGRGKTEAWHGTAHTLLQRYERVICRSIHGCNVRMYRHGFTRAWSGYRRRRSTIRCMHAHCK